MFGESGEARMRSVILDLLPTTEKPCSVDTRVAALGDLKRSKLYGFVGVSCQTVFARGKGLVCCVRGSRVVKFSTCQGDLHSRVMEPMGYWRVFEGAT